MVLPSWPIFDCMKAICLLFLHLFQHNFTKTHKLLIGTAKFIRTNQLLLLIYPLMLIFLQCLAGVDESVVVVMKFSRKRMALCVFSIATRLPNDAVISGTKGSISVCWTKCYLPRLNLNPLSLLVKPNGPTQAIFVDCSFFRSLVPCTAPPSWWWTTKKPSTPCPSRVSLWISQTALGFATRLRKWDSVCWKVGQDKRNDVCLCSERSHSLSSLNRSFQRKGEFKGKTLQFDETVALSQLLANVQITCPPQKHSSDCVRIDTPLSVLEMSSVTCCLLQGSRFCF